MVSFLQHSMTLRPLCTIGLLVASLLPGSAATAAPKSPVPPGNYYFVTVPAKVDRTSPLLVPQVVEVTVSNDENGTFLTMPAANGASKHAIRTEDNAILIEIQQPPYTPFGLSTGVYSAGATVSSPSETPKRFDGSFWIIGGWGTESISGTFALIRKPE